MKKNVLDLTIEEFVRVICRCPKEYELEIKVYPRNIEDEKDTLIGHYEDLYDLIKSIVAEYPKSQTFKQSLKYIEDNLFDYDMELTDLEIYDYLEAKTKGFDIPRVRIILREMKFIHDCYINEERESAINDKIKNGWNDYKFIETNCLGEQIKMVDYKDACRKVFGVALDFFYYQAIALLESNLEQQHSSKQANKQTSNLPTGLQTERSIKYFTKAVEAGYIEKTDTGYKSKFKSKALLAYFLELVFCRNDEGKDDGKKYPETALNNLFNESRLGKARGQYLSNRNGKPKEYENVERLFEYPN